MLAYYQSIDRIRETRRFGSMLKVLRIVTKEAVGIHVPLTRSFFGDGIPRRLLLRVSLAKPTLAALRF